MNTYTVLHSIKLGVLDRGNITKSNFNVSKEIDKYNLRDFSEALATYYKNKYDDEISVTLFNIRESEFDENVESLEY